LGRWIQPDSIIPPNQGVQAWDHFAYVNNSPLNAVDPTGHSACWDDNANDPACKQQTPTAYGLKPKAISNSWFEKPSAYNMSVTVDVPTIMMVGGLVITPLNPELGGTIALTGAGMESAAYMGHPLALGLKATSVGASVTIDTYGDIYAGPQLSFGKSLLTPLFGFSVNTQHIITKSGNYANEQETRDFLTGPSISINSGLGPLVTAFSNIPSGVTYSPLANNKSSKNGTIISTSVLSIDFSWNFFLTQFGK